MKNVLRVVLIVSFAALLSASAQAQTAVEPPPKPAGSGPSLGQTLVTLQNTAGLERPIQVTMTVRDNVDGSSKNVSTTFDQMSLTGNAATCSITNGSSRGSVEGASSSVHSYGLSEITGIQVESPEEYYEELFRTSKYNLTVISVQPSFKVVVVRHGPEFNQALKFHFLATENANVFARGFARAVRLCGGSSVELALAQASTAPQIPNPASGPSLGETMKFIQDRLNEQGKVNYAAYAHDNANDTDWVGQHSFEISNVALSADTCRISLHSRHTVNGIAKVDSNLGGPIKLIRKVTILTGDQWQHLEDAAGGKPTVTERVDPPIYVLEAEASATASINFAFADEDVANRVAKAMMHAIELCGGGNKDPF
jgi:hypothetical protein